MTEPALPIAVTMGEPAGIGGELVLKCWLNREMGKVRPFFAVDSPARLKAVAGHLGIDIPIRKIQSPSQSASIFATELPVMPIELPASVNPGAPNPANADAVIESITTAVAAAQNGEASAVVTTPLHKASLIRSDFPHPGHTEFLGALAHVSDPVMMLVSGDFRVVPVTIHLALREAIDALTTDSIIHTCRITHKALSADFGIRHPRIMVAALNPHAGEDELLGHEEQRIIRPAVIRLQQDGLDIHGPVAADSLFHADARATYDAAICMYHDQALIPLKTTDFSGGVNVTLGLPFVRTSPDHGTAFDIAGKGIADESSMVAALTLASQISDRRNQSAAPHFLRMLKSSERLQPDSLPALRDVIARHKLSARRGLGQNFLLDLNLTRRIVRAAGELDGYDVVEIGPGPGGLTRALLESKARRVIAVERDERCVEALTGLAQVYPDRLTVLRKDALDVHFPELVSGPAKIIANLPYNIATALLLHWIPDIRRLDGMILMFQKEVAERLVALPGTKAYGRLTVLLQWLASVERLFDVPPTAFVPPPKVTSSIVAITPRSEPAAPADRELLERVTAAAFGQRRKMLRSSLRMLNVDTMTLLERSGTLPTARPEELDVTEFCALARSLGVLESSS
tara:strand:- start:9965 stop:11854 length:1890 start_codon:yes stop_codon:yes gene_type:complete